MGIIEGMPKEAAKARSSNSVEPPSGSMLVVCSPATRELENLKCQIKHWFILKTARTRPPPNFISASALPMSTRSRMRRTTLVTDALGVRLSTPTELLVPSAFLSEEKSLDTLKVLLLESCSTPTRPCEESVCCWKKQSPMYPFEISAAKRE